MPTQVYREPGAVEIFLAVYKIREILRLVKQKSILCLPSWEILERLEGGNVDILVTRVEGTINAGVMVFRQVNREIQIN